jgi:hypothetical protein
MSASLAISFRYILRLARFFALVAVLTPLSVAQTAQQILDAACTNDIRQLSHDSLWESTSERRSGGHVYVERTIETVDGDVDQLLSVDGHAPDGADKSKNDKVLQVLLSSAQAREAMHANTIKEDNDAATLLRAVPKMFLAEDRGEKNGIVTIAFRPNPDFQPQSLEQRAIHGMSGTLYIEKKGMRLTGIDAIVAEQVQFGYRLLGTLDKGGTYMLQRVEVEQGVWKTKDTKISLNGRVALFKNISKQSEESKSGWRRVPSNTTILQALAMLGVHH